MGTCGNYVEYGIKFKCHVIITYKIPYQSIPNSQSSGFLKLKKYTKYLCNSIPNSQSSGFLKNIKYPYQSNPSLILSLVCVVVLWPSQPNGVMSSTISLPNHFYWARLVL